RGAVKRAGRASGLAAQGGGRRSRPASDRGVRTRRWTWLIPSTRRLARGVTVARLTLDKDYASGVLHLHSPAVSRLAPERCGPSYSFKTRSVQPRRIGRAHV